MSSTIAALLILLAAIPLAALQLQSGWTKAYLQTNNTSLAQTIATDAGGVFVWQYTTPVRALVYVPSLPALQTRAASSGITVTSFDDTETVSIAGLSFDPRAGIPSSVPSAERIRSYPSGKKGLYLVQYAGPRDSAWTARLALLGGLSTATTGRLDIVAATPEEAVAIALEPYVQFVDFYHAFYKGVAVVDPDLYYTVRVEVVRALGAAESLLDIDRVAVAGGGLGASPFVSYCIRGSEIRRARTSRLVRAVVVQPSSVDLYGLVPQQARGGAFIVLSGAGFDTTLTVMFGAIASPRVERIDADRIRVEVPPGLPAGPIDITVINAIGWRQVVPLGRASTFSIEATDGRRTLAKGDVLMLASGSYLRWMTAAGVSRMRFLGNGPWLAISRQGFVDSLAPVGTASGRYNVALDAAGRPPSAFDGARDVVFAADGTAYAALLDRVVKISRDGVVVNTAPLLEIASIDLAADQCTLVYAQTSLFTSDKLVGQFDVCRWSELPPLLRNNRDVYSVRIAPDKTILAGTIDGVTRLQPTGGVLALIRTPSRHLAISADGSFLWAAADATLARVDLATNAVFDEDPITIYGDARIDALHVYGEWTAARGNATYADDPVITSVDGILGSAGANVVVRGRGFVEGASVTLNGVAIAGVSVVDGSTLRFTMPSGSFANPTLVVTNPAGPSTSFSVRVGRRRSVGH